MKTLNEGNWVTNVLTSIINLLWKKLKIAPQTLTKSQKFKLKN